MTDHERRASKIADEVLDAALEELQERLEQLAQEWATPKATSGRLASIGHVLHLERNVIALVLKDQAKGSS